MLACAAESLARLERRESIVKRMRELYTPQPDVHGAFSSGR
jgi:hypothetical protein